MKIEIEEETKLCECLEVAKKAFLERKIIHNIPYLRIDNSRPETTCIICPLHYKNISFLRVK